MITRSTVSRFALGAAIAAGAASFAQAQDSGPLIDALIRKGVLTDQEGEELRAELLRDFGTTSAGKLEVSSPVTRFKISGDMRLREQIESQTPTSNTAVSNERNRFRFRFRLNGDVTLQKGWTAGFAFETAQSGDSGNQTFENGGDDYALFLARAYIGYEWNDFTFVGGKQKNIFYTTDLIWDSDINPQGLTEQYKWALSDAGSVTFRAGQLVMDDNNETVSGTNGDDAWMFYQQAEFAQKLGSAVTLKVAPGYQFYNASTISLSTNESPFNGTTENLHILLLPGEVSFADLGGAGRGLKLYWDIAYNTKADERVSEAYGQPASVDSDPLAWLVGLSYAFGSGKSAGDWKVSADYREIGLGSIDPNINDSDFAFSNLNQKGIKVSGSYNLNDFTSINATYFNTKELQDLPGAGPVMADLDSSHTLQLDLNVKF